MTNLEKENKMKAARDDARMKVAADATDAAWSKADQVWKKATTAAAVAEAAESAERRGRRR